MREWWQNLPDSTRRAIKTLWQAFFGTFTVTFCMGLTNGLVGVDTLKALLISALSAAVAATASKIVNWYMSAEADDDEEV